MTVQWLARDALDDAVACRVLVSDVVLDIGPGLRPQSLFRPRTHVCIEAHRPYVERLRAGLVDERRFLFLTGRWDDVVPLLADRSVDTVFALDFIEHLEKEAGLRLLQEARRVAREQVVVFTPLGFYPQSYDDPTKPDRWGMDGGYWQSHRSGWLPEDFGEDWELLCCESFHEVDENDEPLATPAGAIWAFFNVAPGGSDGIRARRTVAQARNSGAAAYARRLARAVLPASTRAALRRIWPGAGDR